MGVLQTWATQKDIYSQFEPIWPWHMNSVADFQLDQLIHRGTRAIRLNESASEMYMDALQTRATETGIY